MSDRGAFGVVRGTSRLKAVRRPEPVPLSVPSSAASHRASEAARYLISWPDAASSSRNLQEETRVILSTLMPHEQQILRMRFGIGEARHRSVEEIARHYALETNNILEIEAQALRKLRHSGGRRLKSVDRR